jgi:hypothetical protein
VSSSTIIGIAMGLGMFVVFGELSILLAYRRKKLFEVRLFTGKFEPGLFTAEGNHHRGMQRLRVWLREDPEVIRVLYALQNMYSIFDINDCDRAAFYCQQVYMLIANSKSFGLDHVIEAEEGKPLLPGTIHQ